MVLSFIGPWWTVNIQSEPGEIAVVNLVVNLYQWGIPETQEAEYFAADVTPFYQIILARLFLAGSIISIFFSLWLKGGSRKILLASVGISWIIYAAGALLLIVGRTEEYEITLQGTSHIYRNSYPIMAVSKLQIGYFMAYVAGLLCVLLIFIAKRPHKRLVGYEINKTE